MRAALASGRPPPEDIDIVARADYKFDESLEDRSASDELAWDDEYHLSGIADPRVLVITLRDPSSKLAADIVLIHEHRGVLTALTVSRLPHGPTASFSIHGIIFRSELPHAVRDTASEACPHIILEAFTTPLSQRTATIPKNLFPPRDAQKPGNRIITFKNADDVIHVRHHVYVRVENGVELAEVGPWMSMRLFNIRSGTLGDKDGDVEWATNPYTRTASKVTYL
ncbi:Brix-domain-containing protein [Corynespora cassiicola Philippines]|uniref:U3 small nucleolar ribonucleoprotein protein IMP4 n=1 Tax=Corynespora cassiicola Philippines TaxID=1448308 RepID=A0A2T2NUP1_CORCC|nr:Brix-domain-containing protein [Corynespora cassiicola Philippines]